MNQNIITPIRQILLSFLLTLLVCGQSLAQVATPIPQPLTQFFDANGNPLTSGTVTTYIPTTSTLKNTWQDVNESVLNLNPLTLDAAGRAKIFGNGSYRMLVKDSLNNVIYDYVTNAANPGGATIVTGDGDLVGTIKPWAGLIAPSQYAFAYGQTISRTTFSILFTAITQSVNVNCTSGSPTLSGISDTSQIPINAPVEATCIPPGSLVQSKTATTVVLNNNALSSTTITAVFFPYGNGDGSTTFNLPDLRGYTVAGRPNMGGVASSNLTSTYFGANPLAIGAKGGSQFYTLTSFNLPSITPTLNDPGHLHTVIAAFASNGTAGTNQNGFTGNTINSGTSTTGVTVNHIGGSGGATGAVLINGGSAYTPGAQVLTITGGTCSIAPAFNVTVSGGGVVTSVNSVSIGGNCSVPPTMPASVTGGGGSGAKLDVSFTAQPFATITPTITLNYIIKITPDTSATIASGVASIDGMVGAITCGTHMLCTGNIIDSVVSGTSTLVHNHIFVGDATNTAVDYGSLAAFSDTGNFSLTPSSGNGITLVTPSNSTSVGLNIVNNSNFGGGGPYQQATNIIALIDNSTSPNSAVAAFQSEYIASSTADLGNGYGILGVAGQLANTNSFFGVGVGGLCIFDKTATAPLGGALGGAGECAAAIFQSVVKVGGEGMFANIGIETDIGIGAVATPPKINLAYTASHVSSATQRASLLETAFNCSETFTLGWGYCFSVSDAQGSQPITNTTIVMGYKTLYALARPTALSIFDFGGVDCSGGAILTSGTVLNIDCNGNFTKFGGLNGSISGIWSWNTRAALQSPADSVIEMTNNAGTEFSRLIFGKNDATTAGVSIVKTAAATILKIRNGNDTADAPLTASTITLSTPLAVASGGTNCAAASITCFNNITGFTAAGTTGTTSTNLVFSTSPTLVTPTLGTATFTGLQSGTGSATSSNVIAINVGAASGRFITIANSNGEADFGIDAGGSATFASASAAATIFGSINAVDVNFYARNINSFSILQAATLATQQIYVRATTDATSVSNGSFRVDGGAGIAKRVFMTGLTTSSSAQTAYACVSSGGEIISVAVANTCATSSEEFKENINLSHLGLNAVMQLQPISYYYKLTGNDNFDYALNQRDLQLGFSAEQAAKVSTSLITVDKEGNPHGFRYEQYTAVLTKAIQELKADNDNLHYEINKLKAAR